MEIDTHTFHVPVLVDEIVTGLRIKNDCWYVDATAGGGGHTETILEKGGNVLAVDQDEEAVGVLMKRFAKKLNQGKVIIRRGNFRNIQEIVQRTMREPIYGVLFDLGMSTYQIKKSGRGFSFLKTEQLDMRMSKKTELTAAEIVNTYSKAELYEIFRKLGEEILADELSYAIIRARARKPIENTGELAQIAKTVYAKAGRKEKIHPATRMFQALRIGVNDELGSLREGLQQAFELMTDEGRLAVISFHSLEDRIVKQFFQKAGSERWGEIITKSPVRATEKELIANPASRSARLRLLEKIL